MASLTGLTTAFEANTAVVDTTLQYALGTRGFDTDGNEYIYLAGVTSNVANAAVTYDEAYATTLAIASAVGPIAISQAAVDATDEYGWFLVRGEGTAIANGATADNTPLFLTATAGRVDDADVTLDAIMGMWGREIATGAADTFTVQLDYPKVFGIALD